MIDCICIVPWFFFLSAGTLVTLTLDVLYSKVGLSFIKKTFVCPMFRRRAMCIGAELMCKQKRGYCRSNILFS